MKKYLIKAGVGRHREKKHAGKPTGTERHRPGEIHDVHRAARECKENGYYLDTLRDRMCGVLWR